MKHRHGLAFATVFLLGACQPITSSTVTIIDNANVITLQTDERVPSTLLDQAGITLHPNDRVLLNGLAVTPDQPTTNLPITLQIRRAASLTIITRDGEQKVRSSAPTVGEALQKPQFGYAQATKSSQDWMHRLQMG